MLNPFSAKFIFKRIANRYFSGYLLGLLAIAILSFSLRFWQLARFNDLVFDEVYFVTFARAYLNKAPQFDAHPPLGKYAIAAGIWLSHHSPFGHLSGPLPGPFGYRWMNALIGGLVPLIVADIARRLSQRFRPASQTARRITFALLAGSFVAIDGLFITESRYGLINIYMVFFGLLGHWLWLLAKAKSSSHKAVLKLLAGVCLGGAIATKWNGLGFVLSLIGWEVSCAKKRTRWRGLLFYTLLVPLLTYLLIWLPHLHLTGQNLLNLHKALLTFHQGLPASGHSACSKWYTWPLLIKPIAYWYEAVGNRAYTVNNMGNPVLWWLSSATIFLLFVEKCVRLKAHKVADHLSTYLLIGYAANWLPWVLVKRCTFIYLYMPSAVFSFMGLAWLLSEWLCSPSARSPAWVKTVGLSMVIAIALAFFFWLPLSLGSPLTPENLSHRWWLPSWI